MNEDMRLLTLLLLKSFFKKKYQKRKRNREFYFRNALLHSRLQRKRFLAALTKTSLFGLQIRRARTVWSFFRRELWFGQMLNNNLEDPNFDQHWRRDFRITLPTFMEIVQLVRPRLEKRDTRLRKAVPIEKRVAVAIWRLSTGNSFRTIAKTFAIGKSTAVQITKEFCAEMLRLSPRYIKFPSSRRETAEAIEKFKGDYGCEIPQVMSALDGTHIPISAPNVDGKIDYFSRKQRYTIGLQGLIGANLVFLDVATGFPGSCHDARNLRNSSLFRRAENNEILTKPEDVIEGSNIRPLVLGDGAYPLLPWLVTPYQFGPALTRPQRKFNKKLSQGRVHVERSFGILKARWRCLLKRLDNEIENVSSVIVTCCVLHNICQINKDDYVDDDGLLENILRNEREARQRRRQNCQQNPDGQSVRFSLTNYVNNI